jgi:hypothetical protein
VKKLLLLAAALVCFTIGVPHTHAQGQGQQAEASIRLGPKDGDNFVVKGHLANNEVSFFNLRGTFLVTTLSGEQVEALNPTYRAPKNAQFLALIVLKLKPQHAADPPKPKRVFQMKFKDTLRGRYRITSGPDGGPLIIKTDPDLLAAGVVTSIVKGEKAAALVGGLEPDEELGIIAFPAAQ